MGIKENRKETYRALKCGVSEGQGDAILNEDVSRRVDQSLLNGIRR